MKMKYHKYEKDWQWTEEELKIMARVPRSTPFIETKTKGEWLSLLWVNPKFKNPKVGPYGMMRYDYLKAKFPDVLENLALSGRLTAYLNKVNRICRNRAGYEGTTHLVMSLIESPSLEIKMIPDDAMLSEWMSDHAYPYRHRKEQPVKNFPDIGMSRTYMHRRWKYLVEWKAERLWHIVQEGQLEKDLLETQEEMQTRLDSVMSAYRKTHPVTKDQLAWAADMNMTKMIAEGELQKEIIYC